MGASVVGIWKGITQDQLADQPSFYNDCKAWGDWMAERYNHPELLALHKRLGIEPLLSHATEGMNEREVNWVSPEQLAIAASRLREMVLAKDERVQPMLKVYSQNANNVDPIEDEFARDLSDVAAIATFAKEHGVKKMTLEVNW
ncbi:MAG TPA: hypothetical protein VM008_10995 [Phycisphaerae bacterium]|nr:hypothetical protein [Phycisphaerae bacterium]